MCLRVMDHMVSFEAKNGKRGFMMVWTERGMRKLTICLRIRKVRNFGEKGEC